MYKAIIEIDEYKIGDEVPTDKAKVWLSMYEVPHVEEVEGESTEKVEEVKVEEPSTTGSSILEDYLARGSNVVKKNLIEDELSREQLKELLKLEESGKNRNAVIFVIKKRLAN